MNELTNNYAHRMAGVLATLKAEYDLSGPDYKRKVTFDDYLYNNPAALGQAVYKDLQDYCWCEADLINENEQSQFEQQGYERATVNS